MNETWFQISSQQDNNLFYEYVSNKCGLNIKKKEKIGKKLLRYITKYESTLLTFCNKDPYLN